MRIKVWLIISYIIVMVLPIIMGFGLYYLVMNHHQKLEVEEYFTKSIELIELKESLRNPLLYQTTSDKTVINELLDSSLEISLFIKDGYRIYTTNPLLSTYQYKIDNDELYANLYNFKSNFSHFYYKEPVFYQNQIIGFYEIKMAREQWVAGVKNISTMLVVGLILILAIILVVVLRLVNKKIIHPIQGLVANFSRFPTMKEVVASNPSKDEIGTLYEHVQSMQKELIEVETLKVKTAQEKEMLISSISHDLKTPLTSIRAFAEVIVNNPAKASLHAPVIVEKADYMQKMLADLLMYNLLQSPEYHLKKQLVDGEEFFEMLMMDYEPIVAEKEIKLICINDVHSQLFMDVNQWMRLVDNLMMNAVKFTPKHGSIKMIATENPLNKDLYSFTLREVQTDGVYFIVENSGEGIPKDELEKVLEPLYQVDTARTKEQSGTGLGLTITKQIIEKHGGSIQIVSEQNVGTAVICFIPRRIINEFN